MQDGLTYKELQIQMNKFICRLEELELENKFLKEQQQNQAYQLVQNVKQIDIKHQKLYRKYLKCLYKYGMYQSCLNNVLSQYNKLVDRHHEKDNGKLNLQQCMEKFGIVYENNKIIDEHQMEQIINKRIKRESEEIQLIFFPQKQRIPLQEQSLNLSDSDMSQNCAFQSQQSHRIKKDENLEINTDHTGEGILQNLTTQRYLEKLQFDHHYQNFLNEETITYPKTIKIDKLLQLNQGCREVQSQLITERTKKQGNKLETSIINNTSQLNNSIQEDRVRRFDQENVADQSESNRQLSRRRSRADRQKLQ